MESPSPRSIIGVGEVPVLAVERFGRDCIGVEPLCCAENPPVLRGHACLPAISGQRSADLYRERITSLAANEHVPPAGHHSNQFLKNASAAHQRNAALTGYLI